MPGNLASENEIDHLGHVEVKLGKMPNFVKFK